MFFLQKEEICKQFQKRKQTNNNKATEQNKQKMNEKKNYCHGWDSNPGPLDSKETECR